jgi:hypothetical protein
MPNLCPHCEAPVQPGLATCQSCGKSLEPVAAGAEEVKDPYAEAEWQLLVFAPMWIYDSMGYPDVDLDDAEWEEFFERLLDRKDAATNELTRSVLAALDESWEDIDADYRGDETEPLGGLRKIAELLERRELPDVASVYTFTMVDVAFDLARVSGFEVTSVSLGGEERQRVTALAEALKIDADELIAWLSEEVDQGEAASGGVDEIYTEEEWQRLRFAPFWIYSIVAGADGMRDEREWKVFEKTLRSLKDATVNDLTADLADDLAENLEEVIEAFTADESEPSEALRSVSALIAGREDAETVDDFKHDMVTLAFAVAKATGGSLMKGVLSGLSLSFGGQAIGVSLDLDAAHTTVKHGRISVEEEDALKEIAAALDLDPAKFMKRLGVEVRS